MPEQDTIILLAIIAANLGLVSVLLWIRLRASAREVLAPRLIAELWLTFAVAFVLFRSMQRMLGEEAAGERGMFSGLEQTAGRFAALGLAAKAWFIGGGLAAVALLIHLIVSVSRACNAPLKTDL